MEMCKIGSIRASFHVLLCLYWDVVCYCLSRQTLLRCNLAPHCLPSWSPSRQQIVEGCCLWRLQNKFGKKNKNTWSDHSAWEIKTERSRWWNRQPILAKPHGRCIWKNRPACSVLDSRQVGKLWQQSGQKPFLDFRVLSAFSGKIH